MRLPALSLLRSPQILVTILLCFVLLNGIVWSFALKLEGGADERLHLNVAQFMAREHRIPEFGESQEMGIEPWKTEGRVVAVYSYAGQPGLTYMLAGLALAAPTDSEWMDAHQARFVNIIWMVIFTLFTYLALRQIVPERPKLAIMGAIVAGCWPKATWVTSTFNADGMALACSAGAFWALWRGARRGWFARDAALLGAFAGLVLLGKPTGFVILPFILAGFFATVRGPIKRAALRTLVGLGVLALVAGWWYANAVRMYGLSDPLAYSRGTTIAKNLGITQKQVPVSDQGMSLWQMLFQEGYFDNLLVRFSGYWPVDQITTALPTRHLLWILAIASVGAFGMFLRGIDGWRRDSLRERFVRLEVATYASVVAGVAVLVLHNYFIAFEPRGRYLFPIFVPLLAFVISGLAHLLRTARSESIFASIVVLSMIYINVHALKYNVVRWTGLGYSSYDGSWQQWFVWLWLVFLVMLAMSSVAFLLRRPPISASATP